MNLIRFNIELIRLIKNLKENGEDFQFTFNSSQTSFYKPGIIPSELEFKTLP